MAADKKTGIDVIIVLAEYKSEKVDNVEFKNKIKRAFRDELEATTGFDPAESGTLERKIFKAKRVEDERVNVE